MSAAAGRVDGQGTQRARCVLASNPSPMTLDGTNTWLIAEPGSSSALVVDPGPDEERHLRRVSDMVTAAGQRVSKILLTHGHPDHAEGAAAFAAMTGAPVLAADPAHRLGGEGLAPGYTLTAAGTELQVVATPGHSADSVCLLLPADGALLTGDTVLGRGTTVIAGDGSLADYLGSLERLRALADQARLRVLLPGHGPLLADPAWHARLLPGPSQGAAGRGDRGAGRRGPQRGRDRGPRVRGRGSFAVAVRGMVGPGAAGVPGRHRGPAAGRQLLRGVTC